MSADDRASAAINAQTDRLDRVRSAAWRVRKQNVVLPDTNADDIEWAADEIERLREVVQVVARVLGDPLHFTDERLARAVQRALDSGSTLHRQPGRHPGRALWGEADRRAEGDG